MWAGVVVVDMVNLGAFGSIDYRAARGALVAAWLLAGLFVGLTEELLTRGLPVNLMRKARRREIAVALVSADVFGALHARNIFTTGQGFGVTALQVLYTFFFGLPMCLALRVTGTFVWPNLLHATTDPTLALFGEHPSQGNPPAAPRLERLPRDRDRHRPGRERAAPPHRSALARRHRNRRRSRMSATSTCSATPAS